MRLLAAVVVLALAGCGGGKKCDVVGLGVTASIPGVCRVIANCPGQAHAVEVDCTLNGEPCTCTSSAGSERASAGTTSCGEDIGPTLLKLCGFDG